MFQLSTRRLTGLALMLLLSLALAACGGETPTGAVRVRGGNRVARA